MTKINKELIRPVLSKIKIPIIYIIYNRSKEVSKSFESIRKYRPNKLYIFADGAKNEEDRQKVEEARKQINVDWDCEVKMDYSNENLGCNKNTIKALDYVFDIYGEEYAIMIEDDWQVTDDYFHFCEILLHKYKDDESIFSITGFNIHDTPIKESYYFSHLAQTSAMATWKRSWKKWDKEMRSFNSYYHGGFKIKFGSLVSWDYWNYVFYKFFIGEMDIWDISWAWSSMVNNCKAIVPKVNLIKNIGLSSSTHKINKKVLEKEISSLLDFNDFIHPSKIEINHRMDKKSFQYIFGVKFTLINRIKSFIKYLISYTQ